MWDVLDVVLEVGEESKGPLPGYIAIAVFLRVVNSLGSRSLTRGFSRMQRLILEPCYGRFLPMRGRPVRKRLLDVATNWESAISKIIHGPIYCLKVVKCHFKPKCPLICF